MSRQTFFAKRGPFSVAELAGLTEAQIPDGVDLTTMICDVAPIASRGTGEVTFLSDRRHLATARSMSQAACFVAPEHADRLPSTTIALMTRYPEAAFARAVAAFYPDAVCGGADSGAGASAPVDPTARLEEGVALEPGAVVGPGVEIGAGTVIGANAVVCAGVRIGRHCSVGPGVTIMHAFVGNNVVIHPGARIGQDGFGYAEGPNGLVKLPQIGRVIIQSDVEIGANATIDRGALEDTVIGEGTKIDNLVQIAHNVTIGRFCAIAAQSGISGSVRIGDGVMVGGQTGTVPHITVGDRVQIGAGTGVWSDVEAGQHVAGRPHRPIDRLLREMRVMARLVRDHDRGAKGSS